MEIKEIFGLLTSYVKFDLAISLLLLRAIAFRTTESFKRGIDS